MASANFNKRHLARNRRGSAVGDFDRECYSVHAANLSLSRPLSYSLAGAPRQGSESFSKHVVSHEGRCLTIGCIRSRRLKRLRPTYIMNAQRVLIEMDGILGAVLVATGSEGGQTKRFTIAELTRAAAVCRVGRVIQPDAEMLTSRVLRRLQRRS